MASSYELLASIAKTMRAEHDAGDGHFSTEEVLFIENLAKIYRGNKDTESGTSRGSNGRSTVS